MRGIQNGGGLDDDRSSNSIEGVGCVMVQAAGLLLFGTTSGISVAGLAATTATGALTGFGITLNVGASLLLSSALTPAAPTSPRPEDVVQTFQSPVAQRLVHMGRVKVGGQWMMPPRVADGKIHILIAQMHGEIEERETHFIDGVEVEIAPNTGGFVSTEKYQFKGSSKLRLNFRNGLELSGAYQELAESFPDWTVNHRLNGIATALVIAEAPSADKFNAMYPNRLPEYTCILKGSRPTDPRSVLRSHSENPIAHLYQYMIDPDGMGLSDDDLILASFRAAANDCDQLVASSQGAIPRYRISGSYSLNEAHGVVIENILAVCDGELFRDADGKYGVRVGTEISADVTLDAKHLLEIVEWGNGAELLSGYTSLKPQYVDQDLGFTSETIDPWVDADLVTRFGREVFGPDPNFGMSPSHIQTRFLAKIKANKDNPLYRGVFRYDLHAMKCLGKEFVNIEVDEERFGFDFSGPVKITGATLNGGPDGITAVDISFSVLKADIYSRSIAEEGTAPIAVELDDEDSFPEVENFAGSAFDGGIVVAWNAPSNESLSSRVEYRINEDWQTATAITTQNVVQIVPLSGVFEVRHSWISATGVVDDPTVITGITAGPTLAPPSGVTGLIATDQGAGQAMIDFTPSASPQLWKTQVYRDGELVLEQDTNAAISFIDNPGAGSISYEIRSIAVDQQTTTDTVVVTVT